MECLRVDVWQFSCTTIKIYLLRERLGTDLRLKSVGNLWGNLYIHFLVVINWVRHLSWNEITLKCRKVYKHFFQDCSPRPFYKNIKIENISGSTVWILLRFVFIVCPSLGLQNVLRLRCWLLAFSLYKTFSKLKKRSVSRLSASFSAWFLKKNISHVILTDQTSLPNCFTSWDIWQYVYCNYLLSSLVCYLVWDKNVNITRMERAFSMK